MKFESVVSFHMTPGILLVVESFSKELLSSIFGDGY